MPQITRLRTGPKLSRIVKYNGIVYLCGQVDEHYNDHKDDLIAQTQATLARIDEHLAEAGTDKSKLLYATVYIKDITQAGQVNEIWNAWLVDCEPPARSCVQAQMANPNILVEITVQAAG
ncbi:MAG: RidA family protein [Glaciecola sp.]|jgi:enamine deaminase RidA (YjgF/YER057c/UK114 family)|nr:RidA family protein [Glaciecola sp.]MDG1814940.1 RidA family protein [Glaciecola sp.]MDG2100704.1 RidA family protein [Glaciecola sp.]